MEGAATTRRGWLIGLALALAVLNVLAWSGWRPDGAHSSLEAADLGRNLFDGPDFEWSEAEADRLENGWLPVLVLDMVSEQPVADASVWTSAQGWSKFKTNLVGGFDNLADFPAAEAARTDKRGIAWIEFPRDYCLLFAYSRGFGGWTMIYPGNRPDALARCHRVALVCWISGGVGLSVERPADAEGLPLPIFVRGEDSSRRLPLRAEPEGSREVLTWTAAADLGFIGEEDDVLLRLVPGFCEDSAVPLTRRILTAGRVKVPAPATGQLSLTLLGMDGIALDARTAVYLEEAGGPWMNQRGLGGEDHWAGIAESGALTLRGLPLGKSWNVGFRVPGLLGKVTTVVVGPVRANETVVMKLDPNPSSRRLIASLLHVNGTAMKEREVRVLLEGMDGEEEIRDFGDFVSDAAGNVEFACSTPSSGAWRSVLFQFSGDHQDAACSSGELQIPESGDFGRTQLVLSEQHRAWGVVEDVGGGEVPHARVGIAPFLDTFTAADGSFQFHDETLEPNSAFDLAAVGPWNLPQRLRCNDGATPMRFELQRGSRVHGRLLLRSSARSYRLRVECVGAPELDEDLEAARAEYDVCTNQGWFECGPLPEGTRDLRLSIGGLVVAEVPAVRLVAGELCRDPRLAAIDLRHLQETYVAVTRMAGTGAPALGRFQLMVELRDGSRMTAKEGGLLLPSDAMSVGVTAPGFQEEWQPVRKSGSVFKLKPE